MPNTTTPGYFRIGYVVLDIPPTDITTNRVSNDDQVPTLRTTTPMFVKTGQARWDVIVRWKALRAINPDGTYDYSQWQNLRRIVAIFKASPFVEVENEFLRQHFTNIQQQYKTQRMAFALKQIRVDTNPDSVNVLDVVLTMTLFNYAPFSKDFGYVGDQNVAVSASSSSTYQLFIDSWIANNMDSHPNEFSSPPVKLWSDQNDGVTTFKWRQYLYVPFKSTQPPATDPSSAGTAATTTTNVPATIPKKIQNSQLSASVKALIDAASAKYGLDPAIIEAQCIFESGGKQSALGRTPSGAVAGIGLMQLTRTTAKQLGVDPFDAAQNVDGGCKFMAQLLKQFGNYPHALGAYNAGPGYVIAYRDGKTIQNGSNTINPTGIKTPNGLPPKGIPPGENTPNYVSTILTNADKLRLLPSANTPPKSTDGAPPPNPTTSTVLSIPDQGYLDAVTAAIQALPPGQWNLDHYTEFGAFFYQDNETVLVSADADEDSEFDMFPNQLSVVMVNNLPMIPLAAMQYPVYQHIGPTDTIITIGMNSVGSDSTILHESSHDGVQAITQMVNTLENQFHNLRTTFRAVTSIHRMQAVFMENKVLNLLGIRGTMIRGLGTETVPEASNLVQVSLMASQYENIFEETSPFQINGVAGSYQPILKNILTNGSLDSLSKEEKNAYVVVKEFGDAWTKHDETYLLNQLLSIAKEPLDFLSSVNTPPTDIWFKQRDDIFNALDLNGTEDQPTIDAAGEPIIPGPPQSDTYPGLQIRRLALQGKPIQLTYADFFVFSQLPFQINETEITNLRKQIDAKFASQKPTILEEMYSRLFDWELLTNPAFSRQATAITNSPAFKSQFSNTATVDGPAVDPRNAGHTCYKDLGLLDLKQGPASYFVDYNAVLSENTTEIIAQVLGKANQAAAAVNQTQTVNGPSDTTQGFAFSGVGQGLPGNANALSRMTNIPAYSMSSAFPTYKLMLIEEDNTGPFFAFDNFYSYASVMDIEVIKYRDKPDTAIIQISNLAHLLQHRMYDDTAAGKLEREADRFNVDPSGGLIQGGPNVMPGETGTGGASTGGGITAGKTAAGQPYQKYPRKNLVEGRGESFSRIPLKFFALQTGSKIQVRMGYSNNPDALFPVFTGQVTQIDGDEVLTLTCQGFMLDIMNVPGTTVSKNSRLGFNFLSGGAAFGGWSLSTSGDTLNVMRTLLRAPAARRFGHWQIGKQVDPKIKGFEWTELIGEAMEDASSSTISKLGSLLQTGYDRSGENILVNSSIDINATKSTNDAGRRTFNDENPNWFLGTARYGIDKHSKRSIWELIKDIARRYPYYNLMVKDYGFPYEADATLVYAHPLDWYYYRPPLYGDAEREKPNNTSQGALFSDWWTKVGKPKWDVIWKDALPGASFNIFTNFSEAVTSGIRIAMLESHDALTQLAGTGPEGFSDAISLLHGMLTGANSSPVIPALYRFAAKIQNMGNLAQGFFQNLDQTFESLYREWLAYLQMADPAANSSRIKPVRKYHLIDHNHIVHNSITINDKIYNAVKVKDETPLKFNQNIPDPHIRMLDVTDMIEDPDNNVLHGVGNHLLNAYAQSFLREEVGKMYQGEIVIRGVPEIEPYDVILLNDMSTGTIGPIEVDTVIHSFSVENGYITIIKPRMLVIANEAVSVGLIQALGLAWANASANLADLGTIFNPFNANTTAAARLVEAGVVAGGLLAAAAAFAWAPPLGITLAALGLLAGYGILVFVEGQQTNNFFKLMPLSRFGRPWIGGLQGFAISNFAYSLGQKFRWFDAEEISPTIESWNELIHWRSDYLLTP